MEFKPAWMVSCLKNSVGRFLLSALSSQSLKITWDHSIKFWSFLHALFYQTHTGVYTYLSTYGSQGTTRRQGLWNPNWYHFRVIQHFLHANAYYWFAEWFLYGVVSGQWTICMVYLKSLLLQFNLFHTKFCMTRVKFGSLSYEMLLKVERLLAYKLDSVGHKS